MQTVKNKYIYKRSVKTQIFVIVNYGQHLISPLVTHGYVCACNTTNMDRWLASGSLKRKEVNVTVNEDNASESEASTSQILQKKTKKGKIKRKYNGNYLELGFTYTGTEDEPLPVCILCYETLANKSLKPSNLRRQSWNLALRLYMYLFLRFAYEVVRENP